MKQSTNFTVITVDITCNQTITQNTECNLFSKKFLSIRIVCHNNAYITLNSYVWITHDDTKADTNVNWAWIGLGFISGRSHTDINIRHKSFNSLAILNCCIMTGKWEVENIKNLVINGSKIGLVETCPTLTIFFYFFQPLHFTFSNNNISDCSTDDDSILYFDAHGIPLNYSYLTIVNCTFNKLKGIKRTRKVASTSNQKNIVFQEDSILISVHTRNRFILSVNSSQFIDNKYLILVSLHCFSDIFDIDPINVKLNMYDTIIRNNLATSVLVEGVQHYPKWK